jgi:hypothetical protein
LGGGLENPELDNLTIGSFMQRFGEDVESRSNDGKNFLIKFKKKINQTIFFI